MRGAKAEVWNEREESRCREATVLAKDNWRRGPERDVDSGVVPAAPLEGESVLLVATPTEAQPSGAEQAQRRARSREFCSGQ